RHRIFDFTICENAMQKTVSKSLDRMLDTPALDNIHADTNHAHLSLTALTDALPGSALACSFGIIGHSGEHFLNRVFQTNPHRARDNGVADVQFGQIRDLG